MPAAAASFMLLSLIGCGAPTPAVAPSPPVVTAPAAPSVVAPSVAAPPVAEAQRWVMPNLVGANLQEAQNRIQTLTSYGIAVSLSHDAAGKGRQQLVDNNWKVCDQNIAAGQEITSDTSIDFGTVKVEESC